MGSKRLCRARSLTSFHVSLCFLLLMVLGAFPLQVLGAETSIVIGLTGDAESLDPHVTAISTTGSYQANIFETLIYRGPNLEEKPGLAVSWEPEGENAWIFHLRKGVKFHNGEPFNAQVAKWALDRAKTHPKSLTKGQLAQVKEVQVVDDYTIRLVTYGPSPDIPRNMFNVYIVPMRYLQEVGDEVFGRKPVGTGPYKFVEWIKDQHVKLERWEEYWGPKPPIKYVTYRPIPEDATRVAALLRGEIDVAEAVPVVDIPRIERSPNARVIRKPGLRLIYLAFDTKRKFGGPPPEGSPGIPEGQPNPFLDKRVRQAIYYGVNEDELLQYVMEGSGQAAAQMIPPPVFGYIPDLERYPYDPEKAKKLLAEAGYPQGFSVRLDTPNDRYINDEELAVAIAGQLKKIGLNVTVNAQPRAIFFPKLMRQYENSFHLSGWAGSIGAYNLLALVGCFDKKTGFGRANYGQYCNPELDEVIKTINRTIDPKERMKYFRKAAEIIHEEVPKIPLHYQELIVGISNKFDMDVRVDEQIWAKEIKPRE
ncbi:MAG: ABC transporter substrate-binding protein [Nitrospinota bacterium]|nr:MAG: ABC transporter substrate-binding protein [Nitrospinota bacterium]